MDLFTTIIKLAGEDIPSDRIIDGSDLRADLGKANKMKCPLRPKIHFLDKGPYKLRRQDFEDF